MPKEKVSQSPGIPSGETRRIENIDCHGPLISTREQALSQIEALVSPKALVMYQYELERLIEEFLALPEELRTQRILSQGTCNAVGGTHNLRVLSDFYANSNQTEAKPDCQKQSWWQRFRTRRNRKMDNQLLLVKDIPMITRNVGEWVVENLLAPLQARIAELEKELAESKKTPDLDALLADEDFLNAIIDRIAPRLLESELFITELAKKVHFQQREFRQERDENRRQAIMDVLTRRFELEESDLQDLATRADENRVVAGIRPQEWEVTIHGWLDSQIALMQESIRRWLKAGADVGDIPEFAQFLIQKGIGPDEISQIGQALEQEPEYKDHLLKKPRPKD